MKALRKSLFVWVPMMGIVAGAAEAATASKGTKPMICPTTPNASMTVFTWTADGSSQTSGPTPYTLETSNYTCFRESFVAAYKPTTNDFTLMSSTSRSEGYGKRDYGIISSIEDVKKLEKASGAHIDYVPQHWTELPQCKAPSTEGMLPPWSVQLAYWNSEGTTEANCGNPIQLGEACKTVDCYEILKATAKTTCGKSVGYLYHPYSPTDGYGMQCYADIKNNEDLLKALGQGHHTFLIVP